jgi:hypothetical protein
MQSRQVSKTIAIQIDNINSNSNRNLATLSLKCLQFLDTLTYRIFSYRYPDYGLEYSYIGFGSTSGDYYMQPPHIPKSQDHTPHPKFWWVENCVPIKCPVRCVGKLPAERRDRWTLDWKRPPAVIHSWASVRRAFPFSEVLEFISHRPASSYWGLTQQQRQRLAAARNFDAFSWRFFCPFFSMTSLERNLTPEFASFSYELRRGAVNNSLSGYNCVLRSVWGVYPHVPTHR